MSDGEGYFTVEVVEETYTVDGKRQLDRRVALEEQVLTDGGGLSRAPSEPGSEGPQYGSWSGKGGTSTASGCRTAKVYIRKVSHLGNTQYKWSTSTYWCWTRSTQNIYNQSRSWRIDSTDGQQIWKGIVNSEWLFYDYSTNDGHPRSALKNYWQGRFDNCVVKYGCIATTYPSILIRSYYNGTYVWESKL